MAKHSLIGKMFAAVAGHDETSQYNPQTGQIETVSVQQRPGQFFRNLVAGALVGSAAGAQTVTRKDGEKVGGGGFMGAVGRGMQAQEQMARGQAAAQGQRQQASRAKAEAEQQQDKESQIAAATAAQSTIGNIGISHQAEMLTPDQVMSHNNSVAQVQSAIRNAGGERVRIPGADGSNINGQLGNATELMQRFTKNPESVMKAPEGYHRVALSNIDVTGLTQKPGGGYLDKDGKLVDINSRLRITLMDVPVAAWGKQLTLSKGDLNAAGGYNYFPQDQAHQTVQTSLAGIFAAHEQSISALHDARLAKYPHIANGETLDSEQAKVTAIINDPNATPEEKASAKETAAYLNNVGTTRLGRERKEAEIKEETKPENLQEQAYKEWHQKNPQGSILDFYKQLKTRDPGTEKKLGTIIRDKNTGLARVQKTYHDRLNHNVDPDEALGEYQDEAQTIQDNYEQRVEDAVGHPVEHVDVTTWDKPQLPGAPSPTAARPAPGTAPGTPRPAAAPGAQVQVGQSVTLRNGKTVKVTAVHKDGSFDAQ